MKNIFVFSLLIAFASLTHARSVLRPFEIIPEIQTRWDDDSVIHTLKNSHLEEEPVFHTFDAKFFNNHLLPAGLISYRNNPEQSITGEKLSELIEYLIGELKQKKRFFRDFKVLKNRDFKTRDFCGLLVLKFKNYPFVLKLFTETPQSFVSPFNKGFEPACFFIMGRGIMRHLTGFTRIKNLEEIKEILSQNPYWSSIIDVPRKWYWIPKNSRWFEVVGKNIGGKKRITTRLPSVYALVCDEIKMRHRPNLFRFNHAKRCLDLCQYLKFQLDPQVNNFYLESSTGKLVLIDTEHFHKLTGIDVTWRANNYISWYTQLSIKCIKDTLFRTKRERKEAQIKLT